MIKPYDYFYDAQMKRFLMQVVRAFSGFQYMTGQRGNIPPQLKMVPCVMAKRNRQVAAIQRNMSENTLLSVPMFTVDMTNVGPDSARLQNPSHVESVQVLERRIDEVTGLYTDERGNSVTIDRLMPRPFTMEVQVDLWASNQDQKHQIMEQVFVMMYPSFNIQNSDNALDWGALTTCFFDSDNWTSQSIPVGDGSEIDIATVNLKIPFWLSPPAKIKRQVLIDQVITNINEADRDENGVIIEAGQLAQNVTSVGNHHLRVEGNLLTLLGPYAGETDTQHEVYSWTKLLDDYGSHFREGETQVRLRSNMDDDSHDIIGTIQSTNEPNVVMWHVDLDTLPNNTLPAVNAMIDPLHSVPDGTSLPVPVNGHRYLLVEDLPGPSEAWGSLSATTGSIIQYNNGVWSVVFSGHGHEQNEYVLSKVSGRQLKWDVPSQSWTLAIDGVYGPGAWRLGY